MIFDVIDNVIEKGVGMLAGWATKWLDNFGREVLGLDDTSSSSTSAPETKMQEGLIFVDNSGNEIIHL